MRYNLPSYLPTSGEQPLISVVIPALNEERNLPHVFARLPAGLHEVILVDGGSVDRTVEVARELMPGIRVVPQTRTGKGNALACGFAACTGDIVVMIDADGSTDPAEIPSFAAALQAGADFAKGSRFLAGGGSEDISRLRRLGNQGLNGVVNLLFGTRFTDLCYGYNAFWRRVVPGMELPDPHLPRPASGAKIWGDGFEIETLMNVRVAARGYQVREVPSLEHERIHGASNLHTFRDGLRVLRTILREFRAGRRRAATATAASPLPRPRPAAQPVERPIQVEHPVRVEDTTPAGTSRRVRRAARVLAAAPNRLTAYPRNEATREGRP